jgi:hypothetical protein
MIMPPLTKDNIAALPASSGLSVSTVLKSVLSGLESGIVTVVTSVAGIFVPDLVKLTEDEIVIIGNNFRAFLTEIGNGTPWGEALSNMLTADWNSVKDEGKQIAADFAEAVATVLENLGLIPQGK